VKAATESLPKTDEVMRLIAAWTDPLVAHPAMRSLRRERISAAMDWVDGRNAPRRSPAEVVFPDPIAQQHDAVLSFFYLRQTYDRVRQTEFYFRRYPFNNRDVSKHEHLEQVCSMFFFGFYVFEERMKEFLTALNDLSPSRIDVGRALKLYRKEFKDELRERHSATHFTPFEDTTIEAVMLRSLLASGDSDTVDAQREVAIAYRMACRQWVGIVRARAARLAAFLEAVAALFMRQAEFLKQPPSFDPQHVVVR
jgi:hypothetical protein